MTTARMLWVSPHYFAMCVWRMYGRTLALDWAQDELNRRRGRK